MIQGDTDGSFFSSDEIRALSVNTQQICVSGGRLQETVSSLLRFVVFQHDVLPSPILTVSVAAANGPEFPGFCFLSYSPSSRPTW